MWIKVNLIVMIFGMQRAIEARNYYYIIISTKNDQHTTWGFFPSVHMVWRAEDSSWVYLLVGFRLTDVPNTTERATTTTTKATHTHNQFQKSDSVRS